VRQACRLLSSRCRPVRLVLAATWAAALQAVALSSVPNGWSSVPKFGKTIKTINQSRVALHTVLFRFVAHYVDMQGCFSV